MFTGHDHNYERTFPIRGGTVTDKSPVASYDDPAGTIYVVTGGAGGSLYAQASGADKQYTAIFKLTNHACSVDITGSRLVLCAVDWTGAVFDTLEIRKATTPEEQPFLRGDAGRDGEVDISDVVTILLQLFSGAPTSCADAADADDSGVADVSDAIFLLGFLFLGGAVPPPPTREAATDPTPDSLGCGA